VCCRLPGLGGEKILQDLDVLLALSATAVGGIDLDDFLPVPERLLEIWASAKATPML